MNSTPKTIGILGGMGPAASATLYQRILSYAQRHYHAVQDHEFPPVILYSLPLHGFDETGITDPEAVKRQLIAGVQTLEKAGSDLIIIGCNTVHCFYPDMQSAVTIPVLNLLEETTTQVAQAGYTKVGLFCSETTGKLHLYRDSCAKQGIEVLEPDASAQAVLSGVIEQVMGGRQNADDVDALKAIARGYTARGAQGIILGCTEIPLAFNQAHTEIHVFDTIRIIVEAAVDRVMA